ncbi:MAG: hypothetical protein ACFNLO_11305, partial [Selenomonas massiliensis]
GYGKKSVLQNGGKTWATVDVTKAEVADSTFNLVPAVGATLTIPTQYISNIIELSYTGEFKVFNSAYKDAFGKSRRASANGKVTTTIVPKNYDPAGFNPLTSYTGEKAEDADEDDDENDDADGDKALVVHGETFLSYSSLRVPREHLVAQVIALIRLNTCGLLKRAALERKKSAGGETRALLTCSTRVRLGTSHARLS